jgi:hypothetical protein
VTNEQAAITAFLEACHTANVAVSVRGRAIHLKCLNGGVPPHVLLVQAEALKVALVRHFRQQRQSKTPPDSGAGEEIPPGDEPPPDVDPTGDTEDAARGSTQGHGETGRASSAPGGAQKTRKQAPAPEDINPRWVSRPLSDLAPDGIGTVWVLWGYLARRTITNLTGLWKAGKTTWLSYLLRALGDGTPSFCGQPLTPVSVLVITDESETQWAERRDKLGIGGHVRMIVRPFLGRPTTAMWQAFLKHIAQEVVTHKIGLVVFDALPHLWPVADENDAGMVLAALTPLTAIAEADAAVLLLMHPSKAEQTEGRVTRGSGATNAYVDIITEMRRYDPSRRTDRRRTLISYSRYGETPEEIVLDWTPENGYSVAGTQAHVRAETRWEIVRDLLPEAGPGATADEVLAGWPSDGIPKPGRTTLHNDLAAWTTRGTVVRTGDGTKASPYRYFVPCPDPPPPKPDSPPPPPQDSIHPDNLDESAPNESNLNRKRGRNSIRPGGGV